MTGANMPGDGDRQGPLGATPIYAEDLRRVELAAAHAFPAPENEDLDGWLWRCSGGGYQRTNSVSTLRYDGQDLDATIARVERMAKAARLRPRFHMSEVSEPNGLDAVLAARGYSKGETCLTMFKPVGARKADLTGVEWTYFPSAQWLRIYTSVLDESRKAVAELIIEGVPWPRAFFLYRRRGLSLSVALAVHEDGLVGIECLTTREEGRRRGAARALMHGIEAWAVAEGAHSLYLQVVAANEAAVKLYRGLGYETVGRYHYRTLEPQGWGRPADDGAADHLLAGLPLPSVILSSTDGRHVDISRLAGRTAVCVYSWTGRPGTPNPPDWDDIPGAHGSTPQLEGLRDLAPVLTAMGVRILAVSGQDSDYQREMTGRLGLRFPVLSDQRGELQQALRLPAFEAGGITYLKRLTLLIRDGRIEQVIYPVFPPASHAGDLRAWYAARPA